MTCVQCGKCAQVCEAGAITQNAKGVYTINKKLCVQCGKCKDACPFGVLVKVDDSPASKCIACGICAKACPMKAELWHGPNRYEKSEIEAEQVFPLSPEGREAMLDWLRAHV